MNSSFKRGAEWRKWDLHIHTIESGFGTEDDYPCFIENLKLSDASVLGINDYSSIGGYEKIVKMGGVPNKVLFPIVELRMNNKINHKNGTAVNGGVNINFHIIFDNSLEIDQIKTELHSLECFYEGGTKLKLGHVKKEELNTITFDYFKVIEQLSSSAILKERYLIWVPYDEYGGIDNIDPINDGYFKLGIINKAHFLGSANLKQINYFLSEDCKNIIGRNIPCIKGSDAHSINYPFGKLKDKNSNPTDKYCWIKADTTFEGLKQVTNEPSSRLFIGENPDLFSKVSLNKTKYLKKIVTTQQKVN
ncbi:MAG TPA: hypothetical protein VHO03_07500 [Ignavibacteriales bacterium]|nr:hypothetical protein [Ignavibacteriales bacterium]